MRFQDKVVVVTGGAKGIGRAVCRAFANEGAKVVIADNDDKAGLENEGFIKAQNGDSIFIKTNISDESSIKNLFTEVIRKYGNVDILINNAGISKFANMLETDVSLWDEVISVNLRGPYICSKYASEVMVKRGGGSIINIASTRAFMSEPHTEAYSASKGGLVALTHALAVSLGTHKIRVNSISPGWIDVTGWQGADESNPAILREIDHSQHPAGRVGNPKDIANACMFLCSEEAGFITGTNLTVDGGMTIKMIYEE